MKLLKHEKILSLITFLFIVFTIIFCTNNKPKLNIAVPADTSAVPYLININTADFEELNALEGIGTKTANKIVEYRNQHGDFKSINELCKVSGIGSFTLDKIKDYIKV